ncbi:MAG: DUF92 domain-containing protein [Vicinamibacterales bacterium]
MTRNGQFSEESRQIVHVSMGSLALLLRYLSSWQAVVLAGGAVAFNLYALPRLAGRLYRPGEVRRRLRSGIVLYPLAVLLLIVLFPDRRDIIAAAWGVLAFGDGMATLVGRRSSGPRIPWNREKSVAGSVAFIACGGTAASFLCWWCRLAVIPPPYPWFTLWMPWAAAIIAAAVETIPIKLDDNMSVPAVASATLWFTSLISEDLAAATTTHGLRVLPLALLANGVVAALGYAGRTVTMPGAICGAAIGSIIVITAGWGGWGLLLATFMVAVVSSRLGLRKKTLLGIAEARGGRRGAGNAIANTGVAAVAATLGALTYAHDAGRVAFVAALAAGGSDTVASEIGKAWGRRTILVPTFVPVPPGTSGAISAEGTAAGLIAAFALAAVGSAFALVPLIMIPVVVVAATIGSFAESVLGATLEGPGIVNNDVLNFVNTAIAGGVAVALAGALQ